MPPPTQVVNPATELDVATKLTRTVVAVWRPKVGEHSIAERFVAPRQPKDPDDVQDAARSAREAERRAAKVMRRFCVEHRCDRLLTLTFAESMSLDRRNDVVRRVSRFFSGLRTQFPDLKYMYVLELHPGGHGWHVHAGLNRWVSLDVVREVWGLGFVHVVRVKTKHQGQAIERARRTARYLSKYAAKAFSDGRNPGSHRYERSQGCPITEQRIECDSWDAAMRWLTARIRGPVQWRWSSDEAKEWFGPRTMALWE